LGFAPCRLKAKASVDKATHRNPLSGQHTLSNKPWVASIRLDNAGLGSSSPIPNLTLGAPVPSPGLPATPIGWIDCQSAGLGLAAERSELRPGCPTIPLSERASGCAPMFVPKGYLAFRTAVFVMDDESKGYDWTLERLGCALAGGDLVAHGVVVGFLEYDEDPQEMGEIRPIRPEFGGRRGHERL